MSFCAWQLFIQSEFESCICAQIEEKPSESFILHLDSRIVLFALLHCLKIYQNVLFYNTSEAIDVYFQTS